MRELSLNILDIAENSIKAFSSHIDIVLEADSANNSLYIMIGDNGCGTDCEDIFELERRSLFTSERSAMGLLLMNMLALECGGELKISSKVGVGTKVFAHMKLDSPDLPPLGDLAGTVITLLMGGDLDITLCVKSDGRGFTLSTDEIASEYSDRHSFEALNAIKKAVNDKIENFNGGIPYEKFS